MNARLEKTLTTKSIWDMASLGLYPTHQAARGEKDFSGGVDWSLSLNVGGNFCTSIEAAKAAIASATKLWDEQKDCLNAAAISYPVNGELDFKSMELKSHLMEGHFGGRNGAFWLVLLEGLASGHCQSIPDAWDEEIRWTEKHAANLVETGIYDFVAKVRRIN